VTKLIQQIIGAISPLDSVAKRHIMPVNLTRNNTTAEVVSCDDRLTLGENKKKSKNVLEI
jgi:hypothetical protein